MKALWKSASVLVGIASMAASAHGQKPAMVIDEWSSTSLSLTYDGTTIWGVRDFPNHETWDVPNLAQFGIDLTGDSTDSLGHVTFGSFVDLFNLGWQEPDGTGVNIVDGVIFDGRYPLVTDLVVSSDFTAPQGLPGPSTVLPNGATYSDSILPFSLQINDHGDSVPDGGATCALIGGALLGLASLRRLFAR